MGNIALLLPDSKSFMRSFSDSSQGSYYYLRLLTPKDSRLALCSSPLSL